MRYLLDKNVLRRCAQAIANSQRNVRITDEQRESAAILTLWPDDILFIAPQTLNILQTSVPQTVLQLVMPYLTVFRRTKYQSRWARRLRHEFGFAREDAYQLALATFGTDASGSIIGVDGFVTLDEHLRERFRRCEIDIQTRLHKMTCQLKPPYDNATLPLVIRPLDALS